MLWPVVVLVAAACSTGRPSYMFLTPAQWAEELQRRGVDPREVPNPLVMTEGMYEAAKEIGGVGGATEKLDRLQNAFFDQTTFPFHYEYRGTFTAIEAFVRRQGNCLSFTNLFVAMGRSLGAPVTTALVKRVRGSEKEGDLIIVNNHVVATLLFAPDKRYYDFDRRPHEKPQGFEPLDDLWITALYLNNRGADELRAVHPDIALRYFQYATKLAPEFAPAWGNVGVARRRLGNIPGAFEAYRRALEISANEPTILGNLASLYRSLGMEQEAETALASVNLSQATPHVLLVRGDLELARGKVNDALSLYKRAKSMAPGLADAWVAMGRAEIVRNKLNRARKDLEKALTLEPGNQLAKRLLAEMNRPQATTYPH
jgi:Flp pilus assembly protein TadD